MASGSDYHEYVREHIYEPAGMSSAGTRPQGGGYGLVIDLMNFAIALRDGTILSPESVNLLTTTKPDLGSEGYGFGFVVNAADGIIGHSGGFAGVSANLDIFSGSYDAVVLSNYRGAMQPVRQRIRDLVEALENVRDASKL